MDIKNIVRDATLLGLVQQLVSQYKQQVQIGNHIRTGRLYNTAKGALQAQDKNVLINYTLQPYWVFLEYGTSRGIKPYRLLQKSLDSSESIIQSIENRIAELLETDVNEDLKELK